jgi:hypothetical protein
MAARAAPPRYPGCRYFEAGFAAAPITPSRFLMTR